MGVVNGADSPALVPLRHFRTLARLAGTVGDDVDLPRFCAGVAECCAELGGIADVVVVVLAEDGRPVLRAATTDQARAATLAELWDGHGPVLTCNASGRPVLNHAVPVGVPPRPRLRPPAAGCYRTAHAFPLRHGDERVGVIGLLDRTRRPLRTPDADMVTMVADIAAIGIVQQRDAQRNAALTRQLQQALDCRVVVEQAKGMVAQRLSLDVAGALTLLRRFARSRNRRLVDVAAQIVDRSLAIDALRAGARSLR